MWPYLHRCSGLLLVCAAIELTSSALATTDWKLTVPNKTGQHANDFHADFVGTGGSVNNVTLTQDPTNNGTTALNGPVGGASGFDVDWPALGGPQNNQQIMVQFTTDFPGITTNDMHWTKNSNNIGNVAPEDIWLTPQETLHIDVNCIMMGMSTNVGTIAVGTNGGGISTNQGDIKATFSHNQTDFDAAAEICWAGHFNWLNIVRSGMPANSTPDDPDQPGQQDVTFPWVDTLPGGNLGTGGSGFNFNTHDDFKPFYWSEEAIANGPGPEDDVVEEVSLNTMGNSLMYFDHPQNAAGTMWQFETYLVGAAGPIGDMTAMAFHVLAGFKWKFTDINDANFNGEIISNLMEIPVNINTLPALIADLNGVLDRHAGFRDWNITNQIHIPEPASVALVIVACGWTLATRRRAA